MRYLALLLCFLWQTALPQKRLHGLVLDAEKNTPVSKASIFLNNTSIGTTADNEGGFTLSVPAGRFELIVSSIGYATHNRSLNANEITDSVLVIKLAVKAPELETVVIEPFEKNGWEKWGKWFTENFLGTSEYGQDTRIKNPDVLKFRHSKKDGDLTATALAPLVIENKALGYRITYQLENFHFDFNTHYLLYSGYPFFENLPGSDRKRRGWEKAREEVYYGSTLQFMRALYRNRLTEEGFEVRRLKKIPNAEKERVKKVQQRSVKADERGQLFYDLNRDSTAYYDRIMAQDDFKNSIGKAVLPGDSIAYAIDSTVAGFDFPDYLLVIYKHKKVTPEFRQLFPKSSDAMISELLLINGRPLEVLANGSYFNPEDLLSSGWWGWWEKMGTMLPFDYQPPVK